MSAHKSIGTWLYVISLFNCRRCPSNWIDLLSPLFVLDPLFRRTFLLVVPCSEFGRVASSKIFAPFEICTTLARILSEKNFVNEEEVHLYTHTHTHIYLIYMNVGVESTLA